MMIAMPNISRAAAQRMLAVVSLAASAMNLPAQTDWSHVVNQPVLGYGLAGNWDEGAVFWPAVIKDGDTLRMWYSGTNEVLGLGVTQIGYAWSLNGALWHRHVRNPVLSADLFWEGGIVVSPAVAKDGAVFKMWYGAAGVPPRIIGHAISADGINWQKHPEPVLQLGPPGDWDGSIVGPGTIIIENGIYKIWYWGGREIWPLSVMQIGLATSADGIHWTKYDDAATRAAPHADSDPVLKIGNRGEWDQHRVWSPAVLAAESGYEMWYAGRAGYTTPPQWVGYATSRDGIAWEKSRQNPIIANRPDWGFSYITSAVLDFNGYYHLWYTSFPFGDDGQRAQIGYAKSVSDSSLIAKIPARYYLSQNHPNPFTGGTIVPYALPERSEVRLEIYDMLGRRVKTLVAGAQEAGRKEVSWEGTDEEGRPVRAGVYLYRIQTRHFTQTRKLVLLKE